MSIHQEVIIKGSPKVVEQLIYQVGLPLHV
jgi:hypothetical protein